MYESKRYFYSRSEIQTSGWMKIILLDAFKNIYFFKEREAYTSIIHVMHSIRKILKKVFRPDQKKDNYRNEIISIQ
jgi:hypothetical protein